MNRHALVIGSQIHGLAGVHNDVATMSTLLEERGFETNRRIEEDASQSGIIDGYEQLIAKTEKGDAVFVYYSGHGLRAVASSGPELQCLVPSDFDLSTPDDPRVITALQLSVFLARLTERTDNCVVVLDCCHAAHMSRDGLLPKALPHLTYLDVAAHVERLKRDGLRTDLRHAIGNALAVRVVACTPEQSAFEFTNEHNQPAGMLTDSLRVALEEAAGLPVSWATLIQRVRDRVLLLAPTQRPGVEGPSRRLLFQTADADSTDTLPVVRSRQGRVQLPGARLLGVEVGDEFAVLPPGAATVDESAVIGVATVDRIGNLGADATFEFRDGHTDIPLGSQAHQVLTVGTRWPVDIVGTGPVADDLRAAVSARPNLRVMKPDDPADGSVLAEVVVGNALSLRDKAGTLIEGIEADDGGVRRVLADLALQAKATNLRLRTPTPDEKLDTPFTVEWGRVVDGTARPLSTSGAVLHAGEHVYFRLRNDGNADLYFFLFNIGLDHSVTLVTSTDQDGLRIQPGQEYVIGELDHDELTGVPLSWPGQVPDRGSRPDAALVIATSEPVNLAFLGQDGVRDWLAEQRIDALRRSGSWLQQVLAQDAGGGSRNIPAVARRRITRYALRRIDFELDPSPAPQEETATFLVDDRPNPSMSLFQPRGLPSQAEVRLCELVVHQASGWGDVRVDALVLTGGSFPLCHAKTARFSDVQDHDTLPLDDLLVCQGLVVDQLELAWWVSRDRTGSPDLNDLLAAEGTSANPVDTAHRLLSEVAGRTVGLYRTCLLAMENYGQGRHPVDGVLPAGDFSFAYRIEATPTVGEPL